MTAWRRAARPVLVVVIAMMAITAMVSGCTRTTEGTAVSVDGAPGDSSPGPDDSPGGPQTDSLMNCDTIDEAVLGEVVDAEAENIDNSFVGAICRWQARTANGVIDLTRFTFKQGSLDNERQIAEELQYQVEERAVAGVDSIIMRLSDPNGSCGVASDQEGVVGWWVNPQDPGADACGFAVKLMELTLARNA